jgi:hypothetical protein
MGYILRLGALLQEIIDVAVILHALRALKIVRKETGPPTVSLQQWS